MYRFHSPQVTCDISWLCAGPFSFCVPFDNQQDFAEKRYCTECTIRPVLLLAHKYNNLKMSMLIRCIFHPSLFTCRGIIVSIAELV